VKTLNSLRQELLAKRLDLHKNLELRAQLEKQLGDSFEQVKEGCIAIYWPINSEFDPRPLALNWARQAPNRKLALPIVKPDQALLFGEWCNGDQLQKGPQGIPEPKLSKENVLIQPDVIVIPCLGWAQHQQQFWRVGYGGGYYDRTLEALRQSKRPVKAIGIAYQALEVKEGAWRPQSHDQALDELICA